MTSILVVGGANLDLKIRPSALGRSGDSVPGTIEWSAGGVGRNLAETLARLGARVSLITAVGDDPLAEMILQPTAKAGVDISGVIKVAATTSSYAAWLDGRGEMTRAVAAMAAMEQLTPGRLRALKGRIDSADLVLLDTNLPQETILHIADMAARLDRPLAVEPVSVTKAQKILPLLKRKYPFYALTPNRAELAVLVQEKFTLRDLPGAAERLVQKGVGAVLVGLGAKGALVSGDGYATMVPSLTEAITDVTGAGDAASAAFCLARLQGHNVVTSGLIAQAAASFVIAETTSVSTAISWTKLLSRAGIKRENNDA